MTGVPSTLLIIGVAALLLMFVALLLLLFGSNGKRSRVVVYFDRRREEVIVSVLKNPPAVQKPAAWRQGNLACYYLVEDVASRALISVSKGKWYLLVEGVSPTLLSSSSAAMNETTYRFIQAVGDALEKLGKEKKLVQAIRTNRR